jgi:hypothetical protein|tara:strand:+ start:318 stop:467 length:150 start_codon:yes stop_codon:yes gene_type:complete
MKEGVIYEVQDFKTSSKKKKRKKKNSNNGEGYSGFNNYSNVRSGTFSWM